jgi:hypothetical protein
VHRRTLCLEQTFSSLLCIAWLLQTVLQAVVSHHFAGVPHHIHHSTAYTLAAHPPSFTQVIRAYRLVEHAPAVAMAALTQHELQAARAGQ